MSTKIIKSSDIFSLSPSSEFGNVVNNVYNIVKTEQPNEYVEWKNSRSSVPNKSQKTWEQFKIEDCNASLFLFSLETAHSLASRLLLMEVMRDNNMITFTNESKNSDDIGLLFQQTVGQYFPQLKLNDYYSWWYNNETNNEFNISVHELFEEIESLNEINNDLLGQLYQEMFDTEGRKEIGSFYTPSDVVNFIHNEINVSNGSKIIDPSCGSGRFIIPLLEELSLNDYLKNNIGIDIDPFAVLVSRIRYAIVLSKQLDTIEKHSIIPIYQTDTLTNIFSEKRKQQTFQSIEENKTQSISVPNTKENIKIPKNNRKISGEKMYDIYSVFLKQSPHKIKEWNESDSYKLCQKHSISPHMTIHDSFNSIKELIEPIESENHSNKIKTEIINLVLGGIVKQYFSFDTIIGNPPYINIKNIPDEKENEYNEMYESTSGRYDLYVLFIEWALQMVDDDGYVGFITSNKFMRTGYGDSIRDNIVENYTIDKLVDFGGIDVFEGVTTMASIIIIRNIKEHDNDIDYIKVIDEDSVDSYKDIINYSSDFTGIESSSVPQEYLADDFWKLVSPEVRNITDKIIDNKFSTLEDECVGIRQGISSGCDDVFIVSEDEIDKWNLESELIVPLIKGSDVRRWNVTWSDNYTIYPYDKDGMVNINEYPNIKSYLDSHQDDLEDRYCVRKGRANIYQYDGSRTSSVFEGTWKIVTPDIAPENNFSHPNGYDCFKNTVYVITFDGSENFSRNELLAILNSPIVEFLIDHQSPKLRGVNRRYKSQYLSSIPLPKPNPEIKKHVQNIIDNGSPEKDVFNCVRKMYGLTKHEYEIIREKVDR